jgi:hypothetical protein
MDKAGICNKTFLIELYPHLYENFAEASCISTEAIYWLTHCNRSLCGDISPSRISVNRGTFSSVVYIFLY